MSNNGLSPTIENDNSCPLCEVADTFTKSVCCETDSLHVAENEACFQMGGNWSCVFTMRALTVVLAVSGTVPLSLAWTTTCIVCCNQKTSRTDKEGIWYWLKDNFHQFSISRGGSNENHNVCFYGEIWIIIPKLLPNTLLISSTEICIWATTWQNVCSESFRQGQTQTVTKAS